jgi:hypothetical protein
MRSLGMVKTGAACHGTACLATPMGTDGHMAPSNE